MFPELVTRPDLEVFLPPIGGTTVYFFGDVATLGKPETRIACRVHDECNGSDVFGSDICTCRPYLAHGIEVCIETAQKGGVGVVVYNRKEGRALGEVTKFLVYNARKRQAGGDSAAHLLPPHRMRRRRAGHALPGADARRPPLARHHAHRPLRLDERHEVTTRSREQGIEIVERVAIPDELIPADAQVEMDAKKAAGYFSATKPGTTDLVEAQGAGFE